MHREKSPYLPASCRHKGIAVFLEEHKMSGSSKPEYSFNMLLVYIWSNTLQGPVTEERVFVMETVT